MPQVQMVQIQIPSHVRPKVDADKPVKLEHRPNQIKNVHSQSTQKLCRKSETINTVHYNRYRAYKNLVSNVWI